jgi:hypothetical protein
MRELNIGTKRFTKVLALDEPGKGYAYHEYVVIKADSDYSSPETLALAGVHFQNGPVKEFGINGCHQEDLIAICIDRLRSFQAGEYACRENALALTKLEEALHWLRHRTSEREDRGVEGTSVK